MDELIPAFDFHRVFVAPWTTELGTYGWIALMGFLIGASCGLVGNYLLLRRLALMGDAVSHSVLPGLVIAFLVSNSRGTWAMYVGALVAGVLATVLIELIHTRTRVKQDAAMGITFSTLFAIGVILVAVYASEVDLDTDCVLYGELSLTALSVMAEPVEFFGVVVGSPGVLRMAAVLLVVIVLILAFYKQLLVCAFDPGLARSLGLNTTFVHFALMAVLSVVVVSAFEAVGAILVIAMLILPGATASLLTKRLPLMHGLAVVHAAVSAVLGVHLEAWLQCSSGPAIVVAGSFLFAIAWVFSPEEGLINRWRRQRGGAVAEPSAV